MADYYTVQYCLTRVRHRGSYSASVLRLYFVIMRIGIFEYKFKILSRI